MQLRFVWLSCFLLNISTACPAASISGWKVTSPYPEATPLRKVAFGKGAFVAAGDTALLVSSDGGTTWQRAPDVPELGFTSVTYGNGLFVAVGAFDKAYTSEDGIMWVLRELPDNAGLLTVTFGNGTFIATGKAGLILRSSDGISWSRISEIDDRVPQIPRGDLSLAAFGNSQFLVNEVGTISLSSPDGIHWIRFSGAFPSPDPGCPHLCPVWKSVNSLTFANSSFLLRADAGPADLVTLGQTLTSTDGVTWSSIGPTGSPGQILDSANGHFVLFNKFPTGAEPAHQSTNLIDWIQIPLPIPDEERQTALPVPQSITYGTTNYVIVGASGSGPMVAQGPELNTLQRIDSPAKQVYLTGLVKRGPSLVAGARAPSFAPAAMITSTNNGQTFRAVALPVSTGIFGVAAGDNQFVAVGAEGVVLRSADGLTWNRRLSNVSSDLNAVTFGGDLWVGVGSNGRIITSPDGANFRIGNSGTEARLAAVAYGGGTYVAVGQTGAILTSADAKNWDIYGTDEAADLIAVACGNHHYVAASASGSVHVSTNGAAWETVKVSSAPLVDVAFARGLFVATTSSTTGYTSSDGIHWTPLTLPRVSAQIDEAEGDLFILGPSDAFIAKANFTTNNSITLSASFEKGCLKLSAVLPGPGTYRVLTSDNLVPPWSLATVLTNLNGDFSWTDPAPVATKKFYVIQSNY